MSVERLSTARLLCVNIRTRKQSEKLKQDNNSRKKLYLSTNMIIFAVIKQIGYRWKDVFQGYLISRKRKKAVYVRKEKSNVCKCFLKLKTQAPIFYSIYSIREQSRLSEYSFVFLQKNIRVKGSNCLKKIEIFMFIHPKSNFVTQFY